MTSSTPLVEAFIARREALRRYFASRVGGSDAEDLLQEAYVRVASLPTDLEVQSPGAYLYRLCANIVLDRLRQQRARSARDTQWRATSTIVTDAGEGVDDTVPADRALIARDRLQRLQVALLDLPRPAREAFSLHKFEGLSHSEVAEHLGVSRSMVEKHIMRVMKHLLTVEE